MASQSTMQASSSSKIQISSVQIDPRIEKPAIGGGKTGPAGSTRDNGFGQCPAFTHYHDEYNEFLYSTDSRVFGEVDNQIGHVAHLDGKCHDDITDEPVADPDRRKLPKPTFHANPDLNWL